MSIQATIPPYYYPTTVVFIDDDESFLDNLSVWLPANLAFRMYSQPHKALAHIHEITADGPLSARCFTLAPGPQPEDGSIRLKIGPVSEALYTEQRFLEISVAIIDYDMPALNGLDVCRQLRDTTIKKILLTGKADEQIAIKAFNDGLIDRFISKGNQALGDRLWTAIQELQQDYFNKASRPITNTLHRHLEGFLSDPAFVSYFQDMQRQREWVEHYLTPDPLGLLCLNADGQASLLLISSHERRRQSLMQAKRLGAPTHLLSLIEHGELLTDIPKTADTPIDWRSHIHLAQALPGSADWSVAIVEHPKVLKYEGDSLFTYRYYLEILDYIQQEPQT